MITCNVYDRGEVYRVDTFDTLEDGIADWKQSPRDNDHSCVLVFGDEVLTIVATITDMSPPEVMTNCEEWADHCIVFCADERVEFWASRYVLNADGSLNRVEMRKGNEG